MSIAILALLVALVAVLAAAALIAGKTRPRDEPPATPVEPGAQLVEREVQPLEREVQPVEPGVQLVEREVQPVEHEVRLLEPGTQPVKPGVQLVEPGARRAEPGAQPVERPLLVEPRPLRSTRPRNYPIVLAHGILGFDAIRVGSVSRDYFRGVPARLRELGADVHVVRLPPLGRIAPRAAALAEQVRSIDAERVIIVAHSMGGLDARYAIAELGLHERVAALVTIGTPHRGTPVADGGASMGGFVRLARTLRLLDADLAAIGDLTTRSMEEFNRRVRDVPGVMYLSYVGAPRVHSVNAVLRASMRFLARRAGPNDGLVPVESQRWGRVLGEIDADHWAQIGWGGFDAAGFYEDVVLGLRARGL